MLGFRGCSHVNYMREKPGYMLGTWSRHMEAGNSPKNCSIQKSHAASMSGPEGGQ